MHEELDQKSKEYWAKRFDIKPEEVSWYHSGICYDRIGVTTEEAAEKVKAKMKGNYANGGMLHGMELGGYSKGPDGIYDVYC